MKRTISALLILTLLLTLFSACSSDAGTSGTASTAAATTAAATTAAAKTTAAATTAAATTAAATTAPTSTLAAPDPNTKYEISFYSFWCGEVEDDNYVEKLIEDALNIELTVRKVNHQNAEQVNLMLASGDMPDVGWYTKTPEEMLDEELIRTIPVDLVKAYAPNYIRIYDENPIIYPQALSSEDETQFNCLPGVSDTFTQLYLYCDFYRYDWIQALGIDLGVNVEKVSDNLVVAEKGIPLDTFRTILDGYVNGDPDGNGKKDTIGMTSNRGSFTNIASGFDFIMGVNNVDGDAAMWYALPQYKEMLKFLAGLYKDGLIDQEIMTQETANWWEKINNNSAGYFHSSTNALNSWAMNRPPLMLFEKNPAAVLMMTPGLQSETGNTYQQKSTSPLNGRCYINKDVTDDAKLAKILEFIDYASFGDTVASHWNGEEGVEWEMRDGKPVKTNPVLNGVKGTQVYNLFMQVEEPWEWLTFEPLFESGAKYYVKSQGGAWNVGWQYAYKEDVAGVTNAAKINSEKGADIKAIYEAYYMDCILGKQDVDATWDKYIENLNKAGYADYIAEINKAAVVEELIAEYSK